MSEHPRPKDKLQEYGYRFDTDGNVTHTSPDAASVFRSHRDELDAIRTAIRRQDPKLCLCAHEQVTAANFKTKDEIQKVLALPPEESRRIILPLLCATEFRENNPLCAHASYSFQPDPYGTQIDRLMTMGILDMESWADLMQQMSREITQVDRMAAGTRWAGREWLEKKLAAESSRKKFRDDDERDAWMKQCAKALEGNAARQQEDAIAQVRKAQEPLQRKLNAMKGTLIRILDTVIQEIDKEGK